MKSSFVLKTGMAVTVLMLGASAFAAPTPSPPPAEYKVEVVGVQGSGCASPSDYTAVISPDGTAFTVSYHQYLAYAGYNPATGAPYPAVTTTAEFGNRTNCLLTIKVDAPPGFTYGIAEIDQHGVMSLRPHASVRGIVQIWFQGIPNKTFNINHDLRSTISTPGCNPLFSSCSSVTITDPVGNVGVSYPLGMDTQDAVTGLDAPTWETDDSTPIASVVFNPCGQHLDLVANTSLIVAEPPSFAYESQSTLEADATDGGLTTIYHLVWATCT